MRFHAFPVVPSARTIVESLETRVLLANAASGPFQHFDTSSISHAFDGQFSRIAPSPTDAQGGYGPWLATHTAPRPAGPNIYSAWRPTATDVFEATPRYVPGATFSTSAIHSLTNEGDPTPPDGSGGSIIPGPVTPGSPNIQPPEPPINPIGWQAQPKMLTLQWDEALGNPDSYAVYVSVDGAEFTKHATVDAATTTYDYSSRQTVSVAFRVSASNAGGESALEDVLFDDNNYPVYVQGTVTVPTPTGLSQNGAGYTDGVTLSWLPSAGAAGYLVEWFDGNDWVAIDETSDTTYTDSYPALGGHAYRVVAYQDESDPVYSQPTSPITITPIAPPVAWHDSIAAPTARNTLTPFSVLHDQSTTFSVLGNDRDYDGQAIEINAFTQPSHGTLTLGGDGQFTYTPATHFVGTDSFTYTLTDGTATSAPATASIDVFNTSPRGSARHYAYTDEDVFRSLSIGGDICENALYVDLTATDTDGDSLTYTVTTLPEHGNVVFEPTAGRYVYSTMPGFEFSDLFGVTATDGVGESEEYLISVSLGTAMQTSSFYYGEHLRDHSRGNLIVTWEQNYLSQPQVAPSVDVSASIGQIAHRQVLSSPGDQFYEVSVDMVPTPNTPFAFRLRVGNVVRDIVDYFQTAADDGPAEYHDIGTYSVSACSPSYATLDNYRFDSAGSYFLVSQPAHGQISFQPGQGYLYTPNSTEEPFIGYDSFVVQQGHPQGMQYTVHLAVDYPNPVTPPVKPLEWVVPETPADIPATTAGLTKGYTDTENLLKELVNGLAKMGYKFNGLHTVSDAQFDTSLTDVTNHIDPLTTLYTNYIGYLTGLNIAAGKFLAKQWYVSAADVELHQKINRLPFSVGSLKASAAKMEALVQSLIAYGDGAAIAVDTASKTVLYAEGLHKVLTSVEAAGGATALVQTGLTLATEQGSKHAPATPRSRPLRGSPARRRLR